MWSVYDQPIEHLRTVGAYLILLKDSHQLSQGKEKNCRLGKLAVDGIKSGININHGVQFA